jgi:non-ribosomal peptide synthetase component F
VTGGQLPLLDPELQFSDFARWQRRWAATSLADRQFDYWKTHLAGASPVFPTVDDLGSALLRSPIGHEPIHLSHDLIARLRPLSHSQGGTLFMALLTGFKALLLAKCRHGDICVATAMANRAQERTERIVGPLENTAIIRSKIDSAISFREALARVRGSVLDGYARQDLPFDILTTRLAAEDGLDLNSLMQVFFVLQNPFRQSLTLPGVVVGSFGNQYRDGQLVLPLDRSWLTLMISETPAGVIGSCTYKTHLFDTDNLRGWLAEYQAILFNAVENPDTPIGRLTDG